MAKRLRHRAWMCWDHRYQPTRSRPHVVSPYSSRLSSCPTTPASMWCTSYAMPGPHGSMVPLGAAARAEEKECPTRGRIGTIMLC
eukprot:1142739-Rhodomonas_salina.3